MKKTVHICLTIVFVGLAAAILFVPESKRLLDRKVLLEERYPGYCDRVLNAGTKLVEDDSDVYLLTYVNKDGFGVVTPDDIQFYLSSTHRMNPAVDRATLCFQDGTGIAMKFRDVRQAVYGRVDEAGTVTEDAKSVDMSEPLIRQIDGMTILQREYDDARNIIYQFRVDADGNGVADTNGVAGFYRAYDRARHVTMERKLDAEQETIVNAQGYVEVRREFDGNNRISEAYFDGEGKPVNRIDACYAAVRMEYDENGNCILEQYYDESGGLTRSSAGYASVKRVYDEEKMIRESYFGEDGQPVTVPAGYASRVRGYDDRGRIIWEAYKGTEDEPIPCVNGYAQVNYGYDEAGNTTNQQYLDRDGNPVVTPAGFAEVHRTYDSEKRMIREVYYGSDGKALAQAAGYCAVSQEWDGNRLIARTYLDADGEETDRTDGYSKAVWTRNEKGVWSVHFRDSIGNEVAPEGINLAADVKYGPDGWSEWMIPSPNTANSCFNIGYVNLGPKSAGDAYTAQVTIEFKGVSATDKKAFVFWAQGTQDNQWITGNVWFPNVINLSEAPKDGVYSCAYTVEISEDMVGISTFNLAFRCDYWAGGAFRVRSVKVERGNVAGAWSPGI